MIDFGIAKATQQRLTNKTLFTRFQQFIGTPAYMSPEQASLSALDIDTRSDVYSLGVLRYELIVGNPPFENRELLSRGYDEIRRIIREEDAPRPNLLDGLVSALTKQPIARPLTDWLRHDEEGWLRRHHRRNGWNGASLGYSHYGNCPPPAPLSLARSAESVAGHRIADNGFSVQPVPYEQFDTLRTSICFDTPTSLRLAAQLSPTNGIVLARPALHHLESSLDTELTRIEQGRFLWHRAQRYAPDKIQTHLVGARLSFLDDRWELAEKQIEQLTEDAPDYYEV